MTVPKFSVRAGEPSPAGATLHDDGVNFSVCSPAATRLWLQIYTDADAAVPAQVIELDAGTHRSGDHWHVFVAGAGAGLHYVWRADGPADTARSGGRFDRRRELLDPHARLVDARHWNREAACRDVTAPGMRAVVPPPDHYDWEGDEAPGVPAADSVVYELHVGGFTRDPASGVAQPGTFAGLEEKIPYLRELGITHVEFLPVTAFDEQDVPAGVAARGLRNFWGYSPCAFFAPHPGYAATDNPRDEFRDLVKALHRAGIGVILDMVFNHTAEGGPDGPVISFKGLGNEFYYHLDAEDRSAYRDYSGCGNTLNCNHPAVSRFILDCLAYWVEEMHVDGFRLDLASAMTRDEDGEPDPSPPLFCAAEALPALRASWLIAEPWDAVGLYQLGSFPGRRFSEWNADYRDTLRDFLRGSPGLVGRMASRLAGSSDLYAHADKHPVHSINFVTCHDGFTLLDLVSYAHKHNLANGEGNADGHDHNFSSNGGHEGHTKDARMNAWRVQQAKNALAMLLLSQGVPMLLAGDEVLRTQGGNNNAWCQDNATGWFAWSGLRRHAEMLRFVRELIALRRRRPSLRRDRFLTGEPEGPAATEPDIAWHGEHLDPPDWEDPANRLLAFSLAGLSADEPTLYVILNTHVDTRRVRLPGGTWEVVLDTSRPSPGDICPPGSERRRISARRITARAHSVVALERVSPPG